MSKYTPKFTKPTKRNKRPIKIRDIIRRSIMERDNGLCQLRARGCENVAVDAHHIIFRRYGNNTAKNLICVCRKCHSTIHGNNKKYYPILFNMQKVHYPNLTKKDLKR